MWVLLCTIMAFWSRQCRQVHFPFQNKHKNPCKMCFAHIAKTISLHRALRIFSCGSTSLASVDVSFPTLVCQRRLVAHLPARRSRKLTRKRAGSVAKPASCPHQPLQTLRSARRCTSHGISCPRFSQDFCRDASTGKSKPGIQPASLTKLVQAHPRRRGIHARLMEDPSDFVIVSVVCLVCRFTRCPPLAPHVHCGQELMVARLQHLDIDSVQHADRRQGRHEPNAAIAIFACVQACFRL